MWYVVQTMKGSEEKVADAIKYDVAEEDERVFVFENEMEYKVKGQWIKDTNPFFPGYIFIDLNEKRAEDFDIRLRKEKHPLKLLRVDGKVTPIRPEEEEFLTKLGGDEHIIRNSIGFRVDDMVSITSGSFKGWKGEIRKIDRHKRRAVISVPIMGRDVEVTIGLEIIKNISDAEFQAEEKSDRVEMTRIVSA